MLNYDGNLFDAGYLAAMSALLNARMPKYEDGAIVWSDRSRKLKINNIATSTTFCKIGNDILLDPTRNEEDAADARLTVSTDGKYIRAMQKGLGGSFSVSEVEEVIGGSFKKHDALKAILTKE